VAIEGFYGREGETRPPLVSSEAARGFYEGWNEADRWTREGFGYWLASYVDLPATNNETVNAREVLEACKRFLEGNKE